jgi:hypothetical protein
LLISLPSRVFRGECRSCWNSYVHRPIVKCLRLPKKHEAYHWSTECTVSDHTDRSAAADILLREEPDEEENEENRIKCCEKCSQWIGTSAVLVVGDLRKAALISVGRGPFSGQNASLRPIPGNNVEDWSQRVFGVLADLQDCPAPQFAIELTAATLRVYWNFHPLRKTISQWGAPLCIHLVWVTSMFSLSCFATPLAIPIANAHSLRGEP